MSSVPTWAKTAITDSDVDAHLLPKFDWWRHAN